MKFTKSILLSVVLVNVASICAMGSFRTNSNYTTGSAVNGMTNSGYNAGYNTPGYNTGMSADRSYNNGNQPMNYNGYQGNQNGIYNTRPVSGAVNNAVNSSTGAVNNAVGSTTGFGW